MKTACLFFLLLLASIINGQSCTGSLGQAIINQTFGAGPNPGPPLSPGITNLVYTSSNCANDGYYTITNYTTGCWGGWITLTDHTGDPNGYFMEINASIQANTFFIDTIRNLCSSVTYQSGAWVINIVASNGYIEPDLTFTIKTLSGTVLQTNNTGSIPISPSGQWSHFTFNFTTPPGVSSVILSISNNAPGGSGNDLAIDDITFRPVGPGIDVGIQGYSTDTLYFCGAAPPLTLISHVDSCYAAIEYQWQMSTDSGRTWIDIPSANSITYNPSASGIGAYLYRLAAAAAGNISSSNCRVLSSVIAIYNRAGGLVVTPHDTTVCQGSRVILRASGSSNYTWSDGHQGARDTIAALTAGVYIVSGIASAGCTATDTARIHIYAPVANITQSSGGPCRTDSTTLTATGGSSYTWSNLAHTAAITVAPATTTIYTVSISDAHGCTATSSATVQPHTTHRWDIAVTTVPPPCPGQNQGSIYLSVPTGSNYNYSWNTGSTLPNINALAAGHYYATVSDNLGCDTVISVQLNYMNTPIVAVTPSDTTVCPGSTVILSATSGLTDYQWSDGHLGRRDTISVTTSGSYVVSATASPGCYAHDTAIIRLYTTPSVTIAVTAPPSCSVDSTILTAAGGGLYHWNNGAQTGTIHVSPATATTYTVTVSDAHHCTASASATALPASGHLWGLSATTIDPPCPGQNQGSIFLSVPPGVSYHYAWNTGATQPNIQNLGAGNYRVTITDNAGCDTILTAHLSYQTIPIITISPSDTTVCPGEAVTLAATSGFSGYQWSDGHQGQWDTVIVSIGGSYSVSATASPGCFARDTATIRLYSPPSAAIATSVPGLCPSDSATLTGTGGIAFHWSTGEQTATIKTSPPAVTTYTLTVTDGHGCTDTAMVTLAGHPRHLWLLSDIESAPYCQGVNNGSITIQPPPGSSYHYLWNTGDTLVHMDSLGSGSFHLIITDSLRCDTALYFHLAYQYIPMVVISPADTIVCPGSVVYLSATPGFSTYLWTDLTRSMTDTITVLGPGRYSVIATDLQGCQASDTADISLYPLPVAHISELATGHCTTDSIILRAGGGITYSWSTGSISDSVKTLPQGVYSVTVADGHGCTASDTITPQGTSIPWAFTAIYSLPPCPQSTNGQIGINVMDSKPISYLWNTGDTSALISGLTAGTYSVTLAEAPLCDTVLSFAVTYAYSLGISLYPSDTAIYAGAPLQLQAITTTDHGNNYSWIPASGLSCTTCTDPYVWVGTSTSSYIVQVTDKNGCTASDTMYIHVRVPPSIYIPNVFSPNSDGINDFFQIFTSGVTHESVSQFYIEIFDRWGEKVFETNDSEFMWDGVYKGNPMPPGVYVYVAQYSLTGEERSIINKGSLTLIR